ncbi:TetR/AcrR family transcriptional regulator [Paenibacillus humicola]|uniref:TetR/AcrR family transcriptional regulator n=1 Tax=Paenibacillus humicola TaxID=3110540 RepID=UPI00237BAE89|nr:TetR/AcrR family transcriptional regulator [Paenibacillus humicola]
MAIQEDQTSFRYQDPECKTRFAAKLLHPIKSSGFQSLRMDDISKYMDISKATLYKYFSSKEEIVTLLVERLIENVVEVYKQYLNEPDVPFGEKFQRSFTQTMLIVNYASDPFLNDLRETLPAQYERMDAAIGQRNERLREFYEAGMETGAFYKQNPVLLIIQDELMFRSLIDPVYLMKRNLTLRGALYDYYLIKKRQLLTPQAAERVDDNEMNAKMETLVKKIMHGIA